jgi:SAM-dependent methyltransferase
MSKDSISKAIYPEDAFAGTAQYYARYRVTYPQELIDDLKKRSGITGHGMLLDLACGPGRVALRLSSCFREVWAIDLEPGMIDVGRDEAKKHGIENLRWMVGRAEDVEAPLKSFELITIGEAFHRLHQQFIGKRSLEWLLSGYCLATIGCNNIISGKEQWQRIVAEVVRKWTNRNPVTAPNNTTQIRPCMGADHDQRALREAGFQDVDNYSFVHPHVWTIESVIGNLYSTSYCSRKILGDNIDEFEAELKRSLLSHNSSGRYKENMSCGYTLARKPAP